MFSPYAQLHVLIVDDFNSFRMTLKKIMYEMGFRHVDSLGTGEEAYANCRKQHYDLILCDYNLGQGKNGQQLLEELRINKLLKPSDIFILLSAETSRNVVMSAYDCEPDAYLTKPITTKVIEQRLKRLMLKRRDMLSIYDSLGKEDTEAAISALELKVKESGRHSMGCQKLLAELYIKTDELDKAEQIYRSVLEIRELDWAQVGLANTKLKKGDPAKAVEWLNTIIKKNPSCMRAYDVLSQALTALDDQENLQKAMQKAVEVSPMSIGRQINLASVALKNGDTEIAADAYRTSLKYGVNSCHDTQENQLNFVKAVNHLFDKDAVKAEAMSQEAEKVLAKLEDSQELDPAIKMQSQLLGSQFWGLKGDSQKAQKLLDVVTDSLEDHDAVDIDTEIQIIYALRAAKKPEEARRKIEQLIARYKDDQQVLEKIDPLLNEPVSEKGKKVLAKANKKGIDAYKQKQYLLAVDYFSHVEKRFPHYLGIKLNIVQALIGLMRSEGKSEEWFLRCQSVLKTVEKIITPENGQFSRYKQLNEMLRTFSDNKGGSHA